MCFLQTIFKCIWFHIVFFFFVTQGIANIFNTQKPYCDFCQLIHIILFVPLIVTTTFWLIYISCFQSLWKDRGWVGRSVSISRCTASSCHQNSKIKMVANQFIGPFNLYIMQTVAYTLLLFANRGNLHWLELCIYVEGLYLQLLSISLLSSNDPDLSSEPPCWM